MGHFSVEASVLEQLRWHVVVDALDGSTATPWGSALARGELFYEAPVLIERSLKGLSEVRGLLQESLGPDWGTPVFVESFLERAAKGGILEPQELLLVAKVIRTVNKAHHFG